MRMKPRSSHASPASAGHGCAAAVVAQTMRSSEMRRPSVTSTPPALDADRGAREMQHDAALDQQPSEARAHDRRMLRQQRRLVGDEREPRRGRAQRLRQLPLHRQQHLDACGAAADDADRAHAARGGVGLDPRPRGEKARRRA